MSDVDWVVNSATYHRRILNPTVLPSDSIVALPLTAISTAGSPNAASLYEPSDDVIVERVVGQLNFFGLNTTDVAFGPDGVVPNTAWQLRTWMRQLSARITVLTGDPIQSTFEPDLPLNYDLDNIQSANDSFLWQRHETYRQIALNFWESNQPMAPPVAWTWDINVKVRRRIASIQQLALVLQWAPPWSDLLLTPDDDDPTAFPALGVIPHLRTLLRPAR